MHYYFRSCQQILRNTLICCYLFALSNVALADSKVINIGSDPWCPYVCAIDDSHQGLMVDIARDALALSGFSLNLKILNWARAKKLVQTGKLDGIIGMSLAKGSAENYYFSKTQLAESQTCFFKRSEDDWFFDTVTSLNNKIFGWINNYNYADKQLHNWVFKHKHTKQILTVAGIDTYSRLLKLLSLKRIDTFADDNNVIAYELKKAGLSDKIKVAGCLTEIDHVHLAFSLQAKQKEIWAKALEEGINKLKRTQRFEEILNFYGLKHSSSPQRSSFEASYP